MNDYKPGTIAKATVRGVPDVTVMRREHDWLTHYRVGGWNVHSDGDDVTDVRPLVVLDLDRPRFVVEAFRNLRTALREGHVLPLFIEQVLDQIEAQTRPAIEEPKGLGAVVEDDKGLTWVRRHPGGEAWVNGYQRWAEWADFNAVRVLSPGVEQ